MIEAKNVLVHDMLGDYFLDNAMKTSGVKEIGRLRYQWDYDPTGWYYLSRKGEKISMKFFIGTIEFDNGSLKQIIIGPIAISWGWV